MWPIALLSFLAPGLVWSAAEERDTSPGPRPCAPWGAVRPNPDCRRYELCYRGSWLVYGCPQGQAFHFQLYLCVPAEGDNCPGCGVDQPDPGDCGAFFTCRGSRRVREVCQSGQVFDSLVGGCVPRMPWQRCESKESAVTPTAQPTTSSSADASIDGSTAVNPSSLATLTTDITDSAPHLTTEQSPTELSTPDHSPSTSPKTEASLLTSEPFTDYSSSPSEVHLTTELRSRTEQILITPLPRGASSTNMQTSMPPITTKILPIGTTVNPQATSSFVKLPTLTTLIIMTTKEHFPERQKNSTQSNSNYLTTQSMEAGSQSVTSTNPSADSRNENSDLVPTASSTGMLSPNAVTPSAQMPATTPSVITTSAKVTTIAQTAATSAIYNTSSLPDISRNHASQVMSPTYSGNGYEGSDATSTIHLPTNMTPQQYIISPTTTNHLPFIATKKVYSSDRTTNGFSILSSISTKGEPPSEKTRSSNDNRSIRCETSSERPTLPFTITLSYEKPTISTGQESAVSSEEPTVEPNLTNIPIPSNGSKIEFHTTFTSTEIISNDQNSASGIEETSAIAVTSVTPFSFANSSNPMENKTTTVDSRAIPEISGHIKSADSDTTPGTPLDKMTSHSISQPESPSTDAVVQAITKSSVTTEISTEPYMDAGTKVTSDSNISFITDQRVVNYTTRSVNSTLPSVTPSISSTRTTEIPSSYSTAEPKFTSSAATSSIMAEIIPSSGTDVSPTAVGTTLCISGRRLPDVFNCRRYYFCDEHGLWVSKSCFWFFHFDSFSLECRFWNARCEHI